MTHRYLLFDSGCGKCSRIARDVETITNGWLQAQSLQDPAMQALLKQARPGWHWEPTLLEVKGNRIRAFTGLALSIRLLISLGPRRALRVAQLVGRSLTASDERSTEDLSRRRFLQGFTSAITVIALLGFPKIKPTTGQLKPDRQIDGSQVPVKAELYEDFLLLYEEVREGEPFPVLIQCAPAPILCQIDDHHDPDLIGEMIHFDDLEKFGEFIPFRMYIPKSLPPDVQFLNAHVIRFAKSGDIFTATVNFGTATTFQTLISISAQLKYPKPVPVWPVRHPAFRSDVPVPAEKVDFLPSSGVMRASILGNVSQWIERDVLYTLTVEHDQSREAAVSMGRSLAHLR